MAGAIIVSVGFVHTNGIVLFFNSIELIKLNAYSHKNNNHLQKVKLGRLLDVGLYEQVPHGLR